MNKINAFRKFTQFYAFIYAFLKKKTKNQKFIFNQKVYVYILKKEKKIKFHAFMYACLKKKHKKIKKIIFNQRNFMHRNMHSPKRRKSKFHAIIYVFFQKKN